MITFTQEETKIVCRIEHGLKNKGALLWHWETNANLYAELMTKQLDENLRKRIELIRQEEYERGWKDAKAKKAKSNWFSSTMRLIYSK